MIDSYKNFLDRKRNVDFNAGFDPVFKPSFLFDFQEYLYEYSSKKGRCALFTDTGTGKTALKLCFAQNILEKTNKNILILTPTAVSAQIIREGEKFGIIVKRSVNGEVHNGINVTNYEQLHKYNPSDFIALICDESGILKNFDGAIKAQITEFAKKMPYVLLVTATPAPNDFIELGTSSEALGYMGYMDMLNRFFKNDQNNSSLKSRTALNQRDRGAVWRFKGHSENDFWRWVCSWSRAMRKPSDLGFDDTRFILPELTETEHVVEYANMRDDMLVSMPAVGLKEQREERKRTIEERCAKVAELVNHTGQPAIVWCNLNPEGDLLERLIPDSIQVSGKDSVEGKEEKIMSFIDGKSRVLVTKTSIGAWGLNFQHCNHQTHFPTHSYEQYYQGVRRCWRFGQKRPVHIDIVTTEGEMGVLNNLQRKADQAEKMFRNLIACMNQSLDIGRKSTTENKIELPGWM